jgi:SOS-response transcriptional repressor LexA
MPSTLSEILNKLMQELRVSADELARQTGIPASTIKKIRNHQNPNPTLSTLIPIAEFFAITLGQLGGVEPLPTHRIKGQYQTKSLQHIPLIHWNEIGEDHIKDKPTITTEQAYSTEAYALTVEEEDWENLPKGTTLIIDPTLKPSHRDFIIVKKTNQPQLKQLLIDEDQYYLKPVVAGYQITAFTPDHQILGVVVEYKKQLRKELAVEKS